MSGRVKSFYRDLMEHTPLLRCVFGVTLALVGSTTLGYMIPHMTAIFALILLAPEKKPLGLKTEVIVVFGLGVLGFFGSIIGKHLIDYPLVVLPILGLSIFWSFRLVKIPEAIRLLFLMLAVLLPFISLKANALGSLVLSSMLFNLIMAIVVVRIAYLLFPFTQAEDSTADKKETKAFENMNLERMALNGLIVVFPVVTLVYFFDISVALITLVFIVILSFDPFIYQSKKGVAILAANVVGGLIGVLVYNLLVISPSYLLYIFLIINVAFYFAPKIYSGKPIAPIFKTSFNTFFVVMGVISTSSDNAGAMLWERLLQIGLAVIYVIVAFRVINTFNNPKILNA
ncbi:DUF2955 domain-containing protein [Cryomorphaceae bacterium 1068]|nr:DUF2955 domain-containing protein [Cryomorphaceae bacterium 1068]